VGTPSVRRLRLEHDDLGFLEEAARLLGFQSRMLQLEAGINPSRLELVATEGVSLLRLQFSRRTFISGPKPVGRVFCNITLRSAAELPRVHGHELNPEIAVGFDLQREIHFQAPAAHRFAAVLVEEKLFWQTAALIGRRDLDPDGLAVNAFQLHPACSGDLRRLLCQAFQAPTGPPGDAGQSWATCRLMRDDLLPLLIAAIETPDCHHGMTSSRNDRLLITELSRRLIEERLDDTISLRTLYSAIPTSRRTLVYAFDEIFGMAPMRFLRLQRLEAARRALTRAEPGSTTVAVIAQRHGFASPSHFARLYRHHFGEVPGDTLLQRQRFLGWSMSSRVAQRAAK
jgi:AraC family ethanolamine operon transcriptional activator